MTKQWIKYEPEGETKYSKEYVNRICSFKSLHRGIEIKTIKEDDFEDEYTINGFKIKCRKNIIKNENREGIFFYAEPSEKIKIEEVLTNLFG